MYCNDKNTASSIILAKIMLREFATHSADKKEQKIKNKFNTISNPISWKKYLKFNLRNILFILSQVVSPVICLRTV